MHAIKYHHEVSKVKQNNFRTENRKSFVTKKDATVRTFGVVCYLTLCILKVKKCLNLHLEEADAQKYTELINDIELMLFKPL